MLEKEIRRHGLKECGGMEEASRETLFLSEPWRADLGIMKSDLLKM